MFDKVFNRIVARIILPFMLFASFSAIRRIEIKEKIEESLSQVDKLDVQIVLGEDEENATVHTAKQNRLLKNVALGTDPKCDGKTESSKPKKYELYWNVECAEDISVSTYTVSLSLSEDMSNPISYETESDSFFIDNLRVGTRYYWTVSFVYDGFEYTSDTGTFSTETIAPRNLNVDGVTNVRDLGGWKTANGKTVRQGMIYRTGKLHDDDSVNITESGIATMIDFLGVKTEIDLRDEVTDLGIGPLGENVRYINLPMSFVDDIMYTEKEDILSFFRILADESNYPIFFHCAIGTDRTGVCSFLTLALLGVGEDDLMADYMFSNLGNIGCTRDGSNILYDIELLSRYAGESLMEKTEKYLLDIGLTSEEIQAVRDNLTE